MEDQAALAHPARASFHREFEHLLMRDRVRLRWGACQAQGIRLSIEGRRDGLPSNVLGIARRRGEVVLPELAVFVEPVIEYTQAGGWTMVGRALARVAAHEVKHFIDQQVGHAPHGLMQASLPSQRLRARDSLPFRR